MCAVGNILQLLKNWTQSCVLITNVATRHVLHNVVSAQYGQAYKCVALAWIGGGSGRYQHVDDEPLR